MQKFSFTVTDPDGIHARPAGLIIGAVNHFSSRAVLTTCGKSVVLNGGIFALMGLGIRHGQLLEITVEGADEQQAAAAIRQTLEEHL